MIRDAINSPLFGAISLGAVFGLMGGWIAAAAIFHIMQATAYVSLF